jgi:hypothetical protein
MPSIIIRTFRALVAAAVNPVFAIPLLLHAIKE